MIVEIIPYLQCWSENEVNVKQKPLQNLPEPTNSEIQKETGASSNQSQTGVTQVEINTRKKKQQVARKSIRLTTKVKDPKTFEQKFKTIDKKY